MNQTIKILTREAKPLGIVRAKGSYNNDAYWHYKGQQAIITRGRLHEILGYVSELNDEVFNDE